MDLEITSDFAKVLIGKDENDVTVIWGDVRYSVQDKTGCTSSISVTIAIHEMDTPANQITIVARERADIFLREVVGYLDAQKANA